MKNRDFREISGNTPVVDKYYKYFADVFEKVFEVLLTVNRIQLNKESEKNDKYIILYEKSVISEIHLNATTFTIFGGVMYVSQESRKIIGNLC